MSAHKLPLASLRVRASWARAAERVRLALFLSSWLLIPAAAWLVVSDELKLLAAGIIGAALMPLVLQMLLLPGHLLTRRAGRPFTVGAAALTAAALGAWTWAAAGPVLDREYLPFLLRFLWAYCVAVLPLALMASADEDSLVVCAGAAQVQAGVLALAVAQAANLPIWTKLASLALFAAASTWAVQASPKR